MRKFKLFNSLIGSIRDIQSIEVMPRNDGMEVIGKYFDKPYICTITVKDIPEWLLDPNDRGYEKEIKIKERKKKKYNGETKVVMGTKYCLTKSEEIFIKRSYCVYHLDARQISKVSGIPQPAIYTYIRHERLKPVFDDETPRSSRNPIYEKYRDFAANEYHQIKRKEHDEHEYYKPSKYPMRTQFNYEKISETTTEEQK